VSKGVYRATIPNNLLELIQLQLSKISNKQILPLLNLISETIENTGILYKKEYDQALNISLESIREILKSEFVSLFMEKLEKPIENLNLGDENDIFLIEEELV